MMLQTLSLLSTIAIFHSATAAILSYKFPCLGSRVYPSYSSSPQVSWSPGVFQPLLGSDFDCAPKGYGVTPAKGSVKAMMETTRTVEDMKEHFDAQAGALSVEMWISLPDDDFADNDRRAILTVGESTNYTYPQDYANSCEGHDLRVSAYGGKNLEWRFRDEALHSQCRSVIIHLPEEVQRGQELIHVVFVLGKNPDDDFQGRASIYINGKVFINQGGHRFENVDVSRFGFSGRLKKWSPNYHIQLFSHHIENERQVATAGAFTGSVHQVSFHDQFLNAEHVKEAFIIGLNTIHAGNSDSTLSPDTITDNLPPGIPRLIAFTDDNFFVLQGSRASMELKGMSSISPKDSEGWWDLKVEVLAVPSHGNLTTTDNKPVQAGDKLAMSEVEEDHSILLQYSPNNDEYFNRPTHSDTGEDLEVEMESFSLRVVAVDTHNEAVLAASPDIQQSVHVVRVNQPSKLAATLQAHQWSKEFNGREFFPRTFIREPIQAEEPSPINVDQIRVSVFTNSSASLTLPEENRHLAEFDTCRHRDFSAWQCAGSGNQDRILTFVTYPVNVEKILKDMIYDGVYNEPGRITIQIWDGQGGDCLSREEHAALLFENGKPIVIGDECFTDLVTIDLEAREGRSAPRMKKDNDLFKKVVLPPCVLLVVLFLWQIWRCLQKIRAGGASCLSSTCCCCLPCCKPKEVTPAGDDGPIEVKAATKQVVKTPVADKV